MNFVQNTGRKVEVTLRQILSVDKSILKSKSDDPFLKVRVIHAREATIAQKNMDDPQKIAQIIFADDENHIEGIFNVTPYTRNAINKLIELKGKVIILWNFTVEERPRKDFYQTLLKKPIKRLRLSGRREDFDVYQNDGSSAKILKHLPFHFTPMENIYTVKRYQFIDVIAFCQEYDDSKGAESKIEYRYAILRSTRSTIPTKGCSYRIAGFDKHKEIKCVGAVYAMMNLKVTTFSGKQYKSLKITPSSIIVKLELDAGKRTDQCLDDLPPDCLDQDYVLNLLPSTMACHKKNKNANAAPSKRKRSSSTRKRIPLQQLGSNCSSVITLITKKAKNGN